MRNDPLSLHDLGGPGIFLVMARAMAPAPFEPDSRARRERYEPIVPLSRAKDSIPAATGASAAPSVEAPRKRGLLERLDRWFWAQQQRDIEAYLAKSADIHDLEQRMRNLERSAWHRYN